MKETKVIHPFPPIFDQNSKILILGSMPSPKSREIGMYYAHPKNRFWKILSIVLNDDFPLSNEDKKAFLLKHNIAVWDVLKSCEIAGASDSSIRNPKVNNFNLIFNNCKISAVFTLGKTATKIYRSMTGNDSIYLPSTSPANCAIKDEELIKNFEIILKYL